MANGRLAVGFVADAIRAVAAREGEVRYNAIYWSAGPSPTNDKVRNEIIKALQDDLYIDAQENDKILSKARDEYQLVDALLTNLRHSQPLLARVRHVQHLLNKQTCKWRVASFAGNCLSQKERTALQQEMNGFLRIGLQHAMEEARIANPLDSTPKVEAARE